MVIKAVDWMAAVVGDREPGDLARMRLFSRLSDGGGNDSLLSELLESSDINSFIKGGVSERDRFRESVGDL